MDGKEEVEEISMGGPLWLWWVYAYLSGVRRLTFPRHWTVYYRIA